MDPLFFGTDGSPLSKPEDVRRFLGKPDLHWKKGRSAYETAYSWFTAGDLPNSLRQILNTDPAFANAILQKAFFERQTELDALGRPSQTDVLALLNTDMGAAVIGVEAKVDETFGPTVVEWDNGSDGKAKRLRGLCERLRLSSESIGSLRYQLLHRTAATLIEAQHFGAGEAALVVQSFSPGEVRAGFGDFQLFASALGSPVPMPGALSNPLKLGSVRFRLGWIECSLHIDAG
jgi:hypothetical protein